MSARLSKIRFPLLALGMLSLLVAAWAGLTRLGWGWPVLRPTWPVNHGPLMISGFLGTVIGIERAVALAAWSPRQQWTYLGPLLSGLGGLLLIVGVSGLLGPLLLTLGSLNLVVVFGLILRRELALYTLTMALGAWLWLLGNLLWLGRWPVSTVVFWWAGFLILTIAGERLELSRVLRLPLNARRLFLTAAGLFLAGLLLMLVNLDGGVRLSGLGMVALAAWLLRYDVARYTIRKTDLTRFIALCLLLGYGWLGVSGILAIWLGGVSGGFYYDALLHALFVGFVLSMIFGHAPIIFPAIVGQAMPFQPMFYSHLALLHLSLLLRVGGDLTGWLPGRLWGGLFNVVALLLFIANTGWAIYSHRVAKPNPILQKAK